MITHHIALNVRLDLDGKSPVDCRAFLAEIKILQDDYAPYFPRLQTQIDVYVEGRARWIGFTPDKLHIKLELYNQEITTSNENTPIR